MLHYLTLPCTVQQTLVGVSVDQASEIELRTAIEFSVVAVLARWASILSVHGITVTSTPCPGSSSTGHRLLSEAVVSYTVTAKGSYTPDILATQLSKSMDDGEYLRILRESSNLDITSITAFSVVDLNPSPSASPSASDSTSYRPGI